MVWSLEKVKVIVMVWFAGLFDPVFASLVKCYYLI